MRLVILLLGLGIASHEVMAQQVTALVEFTNTWRYNNLKVDLGTAWRANTFNDSAWASGQTLLGFEDSNPNPYAIYGLTVNPIDIGPTPGRTPTIYFRTHFNSPVAGTSPGVTLVMSNLVDDGCVIYLNGTEAGRIRVAANQTYATFATGGTEGALETVVLPSSLLRAGDNVLAVEVHNGATDSSDLAFGARVMLIRDTALAITSQPQSQTAAVGDSVTFSVGVSGGPVVYRWFKNNVIQTSTSNSLVIANLQFASAGTYFVVASNTLGAVTSSNATLTVVADTDGPKMLQAVINNLSPPPSSTLYGSNTINVLFDEPVNSASARNTNNYQLISATNSNIRVPITNINYTASLGAVLNVDGSNANWRPTGEYYLIVNNIADTRGNNINPNSVIGVSIRVTTNLTQMADAWDFYSIAVFDGTYPDIYRNAGAFATNPWYGTNFVVDYSSGLWGNGGGILYVDPNPPGSTVCSGDTPQTLLSFQNQPTLFRRTFTLPAGVSQDVAFQFRFAIDDGLVLYLNGVEILRRNMPAGALNELSLALTSVTDFGCVTNPPFNVADVPGLRLHTGRGNVLGTNVLAAAVYQAAVDGQSDTWFGLEMDMMTLRTSQGPTNRAPGTPTLVRSVVHTPQTNYFVLSWPATNYGYTLQYSTNITGTGPRPDRNWWTNQAGWFQVADQANPYTNPIPPKTGPRRFYRLFRETLN